MIFSALYGIHAIVIACALQTSRLKDFRDCVSCQLYRPYVRGHISCHQVYLWCLIILSLINKLQEAAEDLAPRLEPILQHLMYAFGTYQV